MGKADKYGDRRVLITTPPTDEPGGVATYFKYMKNYFGEDITYFILTSRKGLKNPLSVLSSLVTDYIRFARELQRDNYGLVHLNPSLGSKAVIRDGIFLVIAKASGKRTIVFMHGWDKKCERTIERFFGRIFLYVYSKADVVIVLAQEFKSKLLSMGFTNRIVIETTLVEDSILSRNDVHSQIGRSEKKGINILFLARVERAKGIYEVLKTYDLLKSRHPHVILTIAGDGPELEAARAYAEKSHMEGIAFTGYVQGRSKHDAFSYADIFFFPTTYGEGMPICVLEAMAYGLPIVTRPVGGLRDFFENDKMGFMTEKNEPEVFAELLERLISDHSLKVRIGEFNREYARGHFVASRVALRIKKIYQEVLTGD